MKRRAGHIVMVAAVLLAVGSGQAAADTLGDFDGDGYDDLAVGSPGESVGDSAQAGAVNVLYGSEAGLTATGNQQWTQDSPGVGGRAQANDAFGVSLAWGDFDDDGFDDLVVGAPSEGEKNEGAVHVLPGGPRGVGTDGQLLFDLDTRGVPGRPVFNTFFGYALTTDDFDGDGRDDLAVGVPGMNAPKLRGGDVFRAGGVVIIPGGPKGLRTEGASRFTQNTPGVRNVAEEGDSFGSSLIAANFDGVKGPDLAIGAVGEDVAGVEAGVVHVLYRNAQGLTALGDQLFQSTAPGDLNAYGEDLAAGDFDSNGGDDLAILAPTHEIDVRYSEVGDGLTDAARFTGPDSSITAGDFDSDGFDDLGRGARFAGNPALSGTVTVDYGTAGGISISGQQTLTQDSPNVPGVSEGGDFLGADVAAGDTDGDGYADLAAGAPGEDVGDIAAAGAVNVFHGSANGIGLGLNQLWDQSTPGIVGKEEAGDKFGSGLAGTARFP